MKQPFTTIVLYKDTQMSCILLCVNADVLWSSIVECKVILQPFLSLSQNNGHEKWPNHNSQLCSILGVYNNFELTDGLGSGLVPWSGAICEVLGATTFFFFFLEQFFFVVVVAFSASFYITFGSVVRAFWSPWWAAKTSINLEQRHCCDVLLEQIWIRC